MSEPFDPYYKWLGVSPQEQPPNHYRLLGINLLESDPQVIESAADRQMVYLRTFQTGQHVQHAQKLLNEIAQARVCLLNPSKKEAYDVTLRKPATAAPAAAPQPASVERPAPAPLPQARLLQPQPRPIVTSASAGPANLITPPFSPIKAARRSTPLWRQPAVVCIAGAALLLAVVLGVWSQRPGEPLASPSTAPEAKPAIAAVRPNSSAQQPPGEAVAPNTAAEPASATPDSGVSSEREPVKSRPITPAVRETTAPSNPPSTVTPAPPLPPPPRTASSDVPNDPAAPQSPPALTGRRSIPAKSELDAAEQQVRKIFRAEIEKASKSDGKLELARTLASQSEQTQANPAEHYTMLKMSLDAYADVGEADLAIDVLSTIAAAYEADGTVVVALAELGRKAKTPEAKTQTVEAALEYIEEFLAEYKYDPASKLAREALNLASGLGDIELRKTVKQQQDEVELLKKPSEAAEKLKQNPDDPAANLLWGKYLCLVKQDWPQGLPLLAKSADVGVKAAAELELVSDKQAKQKSALGEAWLELSKKAPAADRSALVARARFWYEDALDELVGLPKTAVERRLDELRPNAAEAAKPAVAVRNKKKKDPLPGMVGRVTLDKDDAGLMVFYQPGRQLEDATLKDALNRNNIKWRSPVQVVLEGFFTVPGTTAVSVSVYFNQSCRGADVTGRMFVDNNTEVSVVSGASSISGRSLSLRLIGGKPHTIRWVVAGKDGIGSCDMRIEYFNPVTSSFENLPIFYLPPTSSKIKTKAEADLSPN